MIRYTKGDIFNSGADCLVNTFNCEGYMGKGIAYQFKMRYPNNNTKYEEVCRARKLRPGQILTYVENGTLIINVPTKDEWRRPSKIEYIQSGLDALIEELQRPTSLRFQKTLYFTNYYYGKDLYQFSRGKYGPYSKALYHATEYLGKYQKQNGLSDTDKTFEMIYHTICSKKVDLQYEKIKALTIVNGIQDDNILEGAATAFYLLKDEKKNQEDQILEEFMHWSEDKDGRFNKASIVESIGYLETIGVAERNLFGQYEVVSP